MSTDDRDAAYRRLRDHYAARTGRTPEQVERAFSGDRAERLLAGRATPDELLAETDDAKEPRMPQTAKLLAALFAGVVLALVAVWLMFAGYGWPGTFVFVVAIGLLLAAAHPLSPNYRRRRRGPR